MVIIVVVVNTVLVVADERCCVDMVDGVIEECVGDVNACGRICD